jgi:DNA-binding LacI/PurR family transcriptional regulator
MTITIHDVARHAGVGIGTVSRVLNRSPKVSEHTRRRVLEAIQTLGFRPNKAARQLPRGQKYHTFGVLLPFFTDQPFVGRLRGVQRALDIEGEDDQLVLYSVSKPDQINLQIEVIAGQQLVDGLLVLALPLNEEQLFALDLSGIRVVRIYDRPLDDMKALCLDNVHGGAMVTEYLLAQGHRRIAYIGDEFPDAYGFPTSEDRLAGYKQALTTQGIAIQDSYIRLGRHNEAIAGQAALDLMALPQPPTAIFAMSDQQALGALHALRGNGWRVPEDVSVVGFDDIEISQYVGLTTMRQDFETSGQRAMQGLMQLVKAGSDAARNASNFTMPPFLMIARQTVAPPKAEAY